MFTGVAGSAGSPQQQQILIPVPIAQYVSNASSAELTVLYNLIKYQLNNRNLPYSTTSQEYEGHDLSTNIPPVAAWTRTPLVVFAPPPPPQVPQPRSPLLPQQGVVVVPVQKPPVAEAEVSPVEEQEEDGEEKKDRSPRVDRKKLHVYRPKDSDWDWKTFRDEVIRALEHEKPISHIFCPKKASYVSIDFTESHYNDKDGYELAEEGVEKLRARNFRVEYSILKEKK